MKHYLNKPIFIKWEITNKCDLRCKFCFKKNYSDFCDNTDKILNIIKEIKPYSVTLLGGEPTLHKDFLKIIKFLENNHIYHNFSTNGYSLYKKDNILNYLEKDNYLSTIQVSMESPDELKNDSLRGHNSFKNAILTIEELVNRNISIEVGTIIKKDNINLIDDMIHLMKNYNVPSIRLIPFIPIGHGKKLKDELFLTFKDIKQLLKNKNTDINIISDILDEDSIHSTYGCGAGITTVNINMDMTLSPCDLLVDTEKSKKFNDYNSFIEIWKHDPIFNKWRYKDFYKDMSCGKCPLFKVCGGYE